MTFREIKVERERGGREDILGSDCDATTVPIRHPREAAREAHDQSMRRLLVLFESRKRGKLLVIIGITGPAGPLRHYRRKNRRNESLFTLLFQSFSKKKKKQQNSNFTLFPAECEEIGRRKFATKTKARRCDLQTSLSPRETEIILNGWRLYLGLFVAACGCHYLYKIYEEERLKGKRDPFRAIKKTFRSDARS